jgi:hypothetical protein
MLNTKDLRSTRWWVLGNYSLLLSEYIKENFPFEEEETLLFKFARITGELIQDLIEKDLTVNFQEIKNF